MKKYFRRLFALALIGAMIATTPSIGSAKTIFKVVGEDATVVETMEPYLVKTGTDKELDTANSYGIMIEENEKNDVVIPIKVSKKGCLNFSIASDSQYNGTTGYAYADLYSDSTCATDKRVGYIKTVSFTETNAVVTSSVNITKAGTYYLKFTFSALAASSTGQYFFGIGLQHISSEDRTLTKNKWSCSYGDYNGNTTYYKIIVPKDGYIKTTINSKYYSYITLCNSKKKAVSETKIYSISSTGGNTIFAVKKGTYYLKVDENNGAYKIKYTTTAVSNKSGSSKAKAKAIKLGSKVKGAVLVNDSNSKVQWYKFVITKPTKINIVLNGSTPGYGKLYLSIPKTSKSNGNTTYFTGYDRTASLFSYGKLSKGTYYLKVYKDKKTTSGYYTLSVKSVK